ncbi:MAG: hypothetical protein HY920_04000 [Elusimicrobia bacterium]|nr:hypothetical protein [Elusimicrobiota bacterium]
MIDQREAFRSRRHLDSLLNVARAIGSEFNPAILLPKIMDYARKVIGAERGFLLLYDNPLSISQIDSGQG